MIISINPASLRISWQPPMETSHDVPITGYKIQYIKEGTQDMIRDIKINSGTTHTISGLVACTKYSVKIAAMNEDRTGPFSEAKADVSGEDSELNLYIILYKAIDMHIL